MKVRLILGVAVLALALPATVQAQFFDDFDSYANGSGIIGQGGWEGWDASPAADALVTNAQAFSSPHSLLVAGVSDVVQQFSGINSGQWWAKVQTYVPGNQVNNLYFIILNLYNHGGPYNWSVQVRLSASEGLVENVGGSDNPAGGITPIIVDQWVEIIVEIDLGANSANVFYNGVQFDSQLWNVSGLNEIQCFDLFSDNSTESYMDNVYLDTVIPVELQKFEVE